MHAVIRTYSGQGAGALMDRIEDGKSDIESTMRSIPGFVSYSVPRTADGGATFTLCNDKQGADESVRVARDWVGSNASDLHASAPNVVEGPVVVHVG